MVCAVGDEKGNIFDQISITTKTPGETIPQVTAYFKKEKVEALGVGCFGPVDLNQNSDTYGCITSTPKLAWKNFDMAGTLERALGCPIGFDTDVNSSVLGEVTFGQAKGKSCVVYMTIGTGIGAGIFANRLAICKSGNLVIACAVCVFPIGASLILFSSAIVNYIVMTVCCFAIMVCSTIFTVQMLSFIQTETPQNLIGKVIAVILTVSMCAQPLGNAFYGVLFELCKGFEYAVVLFSGIVSLMIAIGTKNIFKRFSADT